MKPTFRRPLVVLAAFVAVSTLAASAGAQQAKEPSPHRYWLTPLQMLLGVNHSSGHTVGILPGVYNLGDDDTGSHTGLRVSAAIGYNPIVYGVDLGMANITTEDMRGLQVGLANSNENTARAAMFGMTNWTEERFTGFQLGVANVVNGPTRGAQVGIINAARKLKGVQFGLINMNRDGRIPFLPFVNVGW